LTSIDVAVVELEDPVWIITVSPTAISLVVAADPLSVIEVELLTAYVLEAVVGVDPELPPPRVCTLTVILELEIAVTVPNPPLPNRDANPPPPNPPPPAPVGVDVFVLF
jgi:hypothetical protein